ncbi:uncharacterized protein METZ01_LOCUS510951 [marine metagenome]|uniref:Uncharacterized protein n=1 Tax=marine metagenome TaxID=408172 RepID=A0A383EMK9_9ZZZZ
MKQDVTAINQILEGNLTYDSNTENND